MIVELSVPHITARNAATLALLDAGGSSLPARALLYSATDALLATAPFAWPAGVIREDGFLALSAGAPILASGNGMATHARVENGLGALMMSCDVSPMLTGSGAIRLSIAGGDGTTTQVWAGGTLSLGAGVFG